jgi:ParB-like chromosome segregation protein Spo0J
VLLRLTDQNKQITLSKDIIKNDWSVRETEKQVKLLADKPAKVPKSAIPAPGQVADLTWKGEEIAINRHFKPATQSVQDFIAWLTLALHAFVETDHAVTADPVVAADSAVTEDPAVIAELEALGKDDPGPIYAKLAPGSPLVEMMKDAKWSDFGAKDAKEGLPQLLAALKLGKEQGL